MGDGTHSCNYRPALLAKRRGAQLLEQLGFDGCDLLCQWTQLFVESVSISEWKAPPTRSRSILGNVGSGLQRLSGGVQEGDN